MAKAAAAPFPVMVMNPDWQEGFNFFQGRWFGEVGIYNANAAAAAFRSQGHKTGLYHGTTNVWDKGKNVPTDYWRVYITHPTEVGYYMWFDPGKAEAWAEPLDLSLATWFEFVETTKK